MQKLEENNAIHEFIREHADSVIGVINGFDRLRFWGTFPLLANLAGLTSFLRHTGVLLKDAGTWTLEYTNRVKKASLKMADRAGRPVPYINDPSVGKKEIARKIAQNDGPKGLICVLSAVEPCS